MSASIGVAGTPQKGAAVAATAFSLLTGEANKQKTEKQ
jgi:hypothetical protein